MTSRKQPFVVAALYKFAPLSGLKAMKAELQALCDENEVCGTLLLAREGVNGTIAGRRQGIDRVLKALRACPGLEDLEHKESFAQEQPFYRMKVRIKKEIVTMGVEDIDPSEIVGTYVDPGEWNDLIADPDTLLIDARNDYEVKIGTFKNAVNPHTESFRNFPAYVEKNLKPRKVKKVAMFCTGGIRCEKASAYMKKLGFPEVYHLKGGILKYLETVPEKESLWQGECFVFDQRVSVKHGLAPGTYILCPSCRHPVGEKDLRSRKYIEGVACPNCYDTLSEERRARSAERHRQVKLAEKRGEKHIGAKFPSETDEN
jgi:UPF0176 protein